VGEFLLRLAASKTEPLDPQRSREEQYALLRNVVSDDRSPLGRKFLDFLYSEGYPLPDTAEDRPESDLAVQPDFYYDRDGVRGVCVFVDGASHDEPHQDAHDQELRGILEDRGYRVIAVRGDSPFKDQVSEHPDVFIPSQSY
jgi:hypothetical protein